MTDEDIEKEIAWLDEKSATTDNGYVSIEDFNRLVEFAKTMRKERDIYRSMVEDVQKRMERFRDHASYTYHRGKVVRDGDDDDEI